MSLPESVLRVFRRHGRQGGLERAKRMSPLSRRASARRAIRVRWTRFRFGARNFVELGLPGAEIIDAGLQDLDEQRPSAESYVVSLAACRLRREGVPMGTVHDNPEDNLYKLLVERSPELAHSRYIAYLNQLKSFADACRSARIDD
jgi:hypothetical protein